MSQGILSELVIGIDHVALCVASTDTAKDLWTGILGTPLVDREIVGTQKTEASFFRFGDQPSSVELICPLPGNVGLEKFLAKRGDGMHHIAFAVHDIAEALARLQNANIELLDKVARAGAGGHLVAFLHPRAFGGTLVELVQKHHG